MPQHVAADDRGHQVCIGYLVSHANSEGEIGEVYVAGGSSWLKPHHRQPRSKDGHNGA